MTTVAMHYLTMGGIVVFVCVRAQDVGWGKSHVHTEEEHAVRMQHCHGPVMIQWRFMQ